jgi:hypothetical protein
MRITSIITYFFPFLILFLTSVFITYNYGDRLLYAFTELTSDSVLYVAIAVISISLSALLYILFRKQTLLIGFRYFKFVLLVLPIFAGAIQTLFTHTSFNFLLHIFCGVFLYFSYVLFSNRYMARLTEDSIYYENLFGQNAIIPLTSITKLEEKKNILTFFKELKFLGVTQKLGIAFCDENLDEYEINIFVKAFNCNEIFRKIIDQSNKCGNFKIRQYSI